jgi:histidine ammonia-lyase
MREPSKIERNGLMSSIRTCCFLATLAVLSVLGSRQASAAPDYHPIDPTMSNQTITLTGHDLTIDELVQIARYGAKVRLSPEAKQRQADIWGLMMEGAAEGVPIYLFNRNPGADRETVRFTGDPLSPQNRPGLQNVQILGQPEISVNPGREGDYDSEIADEDAARAIMVVRANQMTYMPASPQIMQALVDFINAGITPALRARGSTGEAEAPIAVEITAALGGVGEAYYHGVRMSTAEALRRAGLNATPTDVGDGTTTTVNADVTGPAALLVADARRLLEWADIAYAMDLNGMNSSVTPLFTPVQTNRPYPWVNYDAARVLDMLRGSYLFQDDPMRIIQDPESLRASYVRQGSAWEEWAHLRDDVTLQMNWSDHNPAIKVGASPQDSWELSTPWAMRYYVKGGKESHGQHGFIFSNANWDPYPLGNQIEAFTIALANMDVAIMLRQERFQSTFFTKIRAGDVLSAAAAGSGYGGGGAGSWTNHEVWQRIQGLINPVPPEGYSGDPQGVEDLDAETNFKTARAVHALRESWLLLASDLVVGARWMDVRKAQDADRSFGAVPTAAWQAFRKAAPLPSAATPPGTVLPSQNITALAFIIATPAASFYPGGPPMPAGH